MSKKYLIAFSIIIVQVVLIISGTAGAFALNQETEKTTKSSLALLEKSGKYIFNRYVAEFLGKESKSIRKEDPKIIEQQNYFDALHYDISLSFDMTGRTLSGDVILRANILNDNLNTIYMNFYDNMTVSSVMFVKVSTGSEISDLRTVEGFTDASYKRENNYIVITPTEKIKSGEEFLVRIIYNGKPKSVGFDSFSFKDLYGQTFAGSLSEPNYGPSWWPSKDLPDDKVTTTMHLTAPAGYQSVSNGKLIDVIQNSDSTSTYNWKSSYPIATYLVSIVSAKFAYWDDTYTSVDGTKQMPVVYYVFQRDSAKARVDWKETPEMITVFAKTFGEYPFIDEKYGMAQFGWTSGAMEHQTLTSMGYLLITGDGRYEHVIAHELAHHWWGDAVTLKDWKNIWLNEGFASYCEAVWEEYKRGKSAYLAYMKNMDFGYFSGTVFSPEGFIDNPSVYATIYQKGAWVLHMLRGVIGDDNFYKALRAYFEKYNYSNAETSDFIKVVEETSGQTLDWFFEQWVYKGTGRPKYEYSWKFENFQDQNNANAFTVRLQLKQVQTDWEVYKMPLKITVVTENGEKEFTVFNDQKDQAIQLTVDSKPKEIFIDKDGWVLKKVAKGKYE